MEIIRNLKKEDKEQCKKLWDICFHDSVGFTDWFFENRFYTNYCYCIEKDAQIISAMYGSPVHVSLRGKIVPGAVLAGCATKPGFERQGYMARLFGYFMNEMNQIGIVVTPHTPARLSSFYKLGHYPVADACMIQCDKMEKIQYENTHIVSVDMNECMDGLLLCYQKQAYAYSGMISRTLADFHFKAKDYAADGGKCIAYIEEGRIKGYSFYFDEADFLYMTEVIGETDFITQSLGEYGAALAAGKQFRMRVAPKSSVCLPGAKKTVYTHGVMGLADALGLLRAMGCKGDISICVTDDIIKENNHTFLLDGTITNKPAQIQISAGHFMQFMVGYHSIYELEKNGAVKIFDKQAANELDTLFPKVDCRIIDEY